MKFLIFLISLNAFSQTGTNPMGPGTMGHPAVTPNSGMLQNRSSVQGEATSSVSKDSASEQGAGKVPSSKEENKKEIEIQTGPYDRDGNYRYFNKK